MKGGERSLHTERLRRPSSAAGIVAGAAKVRSRRANILPQEKMEAICAAVFFSRGDGVGEREKISVAIAFCCLLNEEYEAIYIMHVQPQVSTKQHGGCTVHSSRAPSVQHRPKHRLLPPHCQSSAVQLSM